MNLGIFTNKIHRPHFSGKTIVPVSMQRSIFTFVYKFYMGRIHDYDCLQSNDLVLLGHIGLLWCKRYAFLGMLFLLFIAI